MANCRGVPAGFFFVSAWLWLAAPGSPVLAQTPTDPHPELDAATLWQQANVAMEAGDYELAIELCQSVAAKEPDNADPIIAMGRVYSWQARYPESLAQYDRYLEMRPNDLDARVERARVLGWKGDHAAGEAAARDVLAIEPENVDANLLLASLLEWQGRPQEAAEVYAWIARIDPASAPPPGGAEPGAGEPGTGEPGTGEPGTGEPGTGEPGTGEPGTGEPGTGEPGTGEPGTWPARTDEPGTGEPATGQGTGSEPAADRPDVASLMGRASYTGDINGFARVYGRVGPSFGLPGTSASLGAFAAAQMLKDGGEPAIGGYGGGLNATWAVDPKVELQAEASALYYPHGGGVLDWGALLGVSWFQSAYWSLGLTLDTLLWGAAGQSAAAQLSEVRAWRGNLWSWVEYKRFNLWGQFAAAALTGPGHPASAMFNFSLQPMFRVLGQDPRFLVGYKLWGVNYSSPAPEESGYWSPALYMSHQLALRLEGDVLKPGGIWYVDAGGGFGHEWRRPLQGEDGTTQPGAWVLFPVVSGGAGIRAPITDRFDFRLGGWSTFSSRTSEGRLSRYARSGKWRPS